MVNLQEIQDLLNQNKDERKKFLADPAAYLEGKGLILTDAAKKALSAGGGTAGSAVCAPGSVCAPGAGVCAPGAVCALGIAVHAGDEDAS